MYISESQRQTYLDHALDISSDEQGVINFYASWLPRVIIDAHAHANLPDHVVNIPMQTYNHMMSTFPSFSIDESEMIKDIFFPTTIVRTLRFPHAFRGIDHRAANEYLLTQSAEKDRVALYGLPDDVTYTVDMLQHPRISALKMYYSYLEPAADRIYDIFKPRILEAAQENGVPIVLHAPKVITESATDIYSVKQDFPKLKISVAHLGSSKFDIPQLQDAYDMLAEGTDVSLDTSLNPSAEVCLRALRTFGRDRIIYGSDEPLNLLRSVAYQHPRRGQRITTSFLYHWQDKDEYAKFHHLAGGAVHSQWLCLDALRQAIETVAADNSDCIEIKQKVFHDNAKALFTF
jgi:hypothetical protein